MRFATEKLRDRIYACWIGKNIGGTIGTPYEGQQKLQDVKGFSTPKGNPLPNDDLDLQLAWLRCMDEMGPEQVNSKTLGEYWLSFVKPHWNEYGTGKGNMRGGFFPPLSGELYNEQWKNSNGAWIRTEIWASLYPGQVEKAIQYAFADASVDHGYAEGTYAAIFVAAMESAAYVYQDLNTLLDIGLSKIPADCRVARAVKLVREEYAKGTAWQTVREMLIEQSADIGVFQAPANVAYTMLGLLYGEGDFKKTVLTAVDCGDDTDCTGATAGALMGIMYGTAGIPADWREYIGDEIVTGCLLFGHGHFPESCRELTDCVMDMHKVTLRTSMQRLYRGQKIAFGDSDDFSDVTPESMSGTAFMDGLSVNSQYSFTVENILATVTVNFDTVPEIGENGTLTGRIAFLPGKLPEARQFRLNWLLPEGWHCSGKKIAYVVSPHCFRRDRKTDVDNATVTFELTCDTQPQPVNHLVLDITAPDRPTHILIPVTIAGA